jgi:hypothetical protein
MADITSRVQKKAADLLETGETVRAALLVEPKGTYGVASLAIAALPRAAVRRLANAASGDAAAQGGLAASFPTSACILAATDRRAVLIPSNGISMKEITTAYDLADLCIASNTGRGLGRRLTISFVDGTSVTVDAQRGQPFEAMTAALSPGITP